MAWVFERANNEYLSVDSAILTPPDVTVFVRFLADDLTNEHCLFWMGDKDVADSFFRMSAGGTQSGDPVDLFVHQFPGGGNGISLYKSTTGYSEDVWQSGTVWIDTDQPQSGDGAVFLNGANKSTTDTSGTAAPNSFSSVTWDRTAIGLHRDSSPGGPLGGKIALVAVWNIILSDAEIASLHNGRHPRNVQSASLAALWTFQTSTDLTDEEGSLTLTKGGDSGNVPTFEANPVFIWTGNSNSYTNGDSGVSLEGTGFNDTEGSGKVELGDNSSYGSATLVEQTTTAWTDDEITFNVSLGGLSPGTLWVFVTNGNGNVSSGFQVTVTAGDVSVTPGVLSLVLTGYAPTVQAPRLVTPDTLALSISAFAPSVVEGINVIPSTLTLSISTFAPDVLTPRLVTPTTLALITTGYAPTIGVSQAPTPSTLALVLTTYAPTITGFVTYAIQLLAGVAKAAMPFMGSGKLDAPLTGTAKDDKPSSGFAKRG